MLDVRNVALRWKRELYVFPAVRYYEKNLVLIVRKQTQLEVAEIKYLMNVYRDIRENSLRNEETKSWKGVN